MKEFLSIFKSGEGTYSSKRVVGFFGMMIIHMCYAYKCIVYGDSTDTMILVTADTTLLGVETITRAFTNNNGDDSNGTATDDDNAKG